MYRYVVIFDGYPHQASGNLDLVLVKGGIIPLTGLWERTWWNHTVAGSGWWTSWMESPTNIMKIVKIIASFHLETRCETSGVHLG
jgi:hypothetical protein